MRWNNKVVWSVVELDYLKKERNSLSINQLSLNLAKSRAAIKRKLDEFDGKVVPGKKNKKSYIGKRKDLGISCRSAWEANTLRYFTYIGKSWMYEAKIFPFLEERRGAISYLPDIYLPEEDIWIEVKGFLEPKGRSAIKKFRKYFPGEFAKLRAVTGSPNTKASKFFKSIGVPILFYYNDINKQYKNEIENWE
jgi:hypothetical protein